MKILTIGNSFSQNSTHYLPQIFENAGIPLTIGRCSIGGCSLERHWNNAHDNTPAYGNDYNGDRTMQDMLTSDDWDYVTIQQASHFSWKIGTYHPYFEYLALYVKKYAPKAEIIIQQTWAYRTDNERLTEEYKISQKQMFDLIRENYAEIADIVNAKILPVGESLRIMQELTGDKIGELTRNPDIPAHCNRLGEYIGGLVWYAVMTGGDIDGITFVPDDLKTPEHAEAAKKAAKMAVELYNK